MRKLFLTSFAIAFSLFVMAQEKTRQKEVGLSFSNLDEFGITYKVGTQKSMWRFNTLLLTGGKNTLKYPEQAKVINNNFGFDLMVGREYRTSIDDNFEFRCGFDVVYGYSSAKREDKISLDNQDWMTSKNVKSKYGFNFVLGFNYTINHKLVLGAEVLPGINFQDGETKESYNYGNTDDETIDISGFNYGLKNSYALLTLAYRF